jgi:hypothetical protein
MPLDARASIPRSTRASVAAAHSARSYSGTSGGSCCTYVTSTRASTAENGATIESRSDMSREVARQIGASNEERHGRKPDRHGMLWVPPKRRRKK